MLDLSSSRSLQGILEALEGYPVSRRELYLRIFLYSILIGSVMLNWRSILFKVPDSYPIMYIPPPIIMLLLMYFFTRFEFIELTLTLILSSFLLSELMICPIILACIGYNPVNWLLFQFGFYGLETRIVDLQFITFQVPSILVAGSIILRILLIYFLVERWLDKEKKSLIEDLSVEKELIWNLSKEENENV